jgi:hypothetical protein
MKKFNRKFIIEKEKYKRERKWNNKWYKSISNFKNIKDKIILNKNIS